MTIKKWRPFWSYDVEKTENWLAEMALDGYRLVNINLVTRMFSFERGALKRSNFKLFLINPVRSCRID